MNRHHTKAENEHDTTTKNKRSSRSGGLASAQGSAHQPCLEDGGGIGFVTASTEERQTVRFEGAVIREQGVTFGIVVVKGSALNDPTRRDRLATQASRVFGGLPTILMAQQVDGRARYYGRSDLVRFMSKVPLQAVPWKQYRTAA